MSISGKLRVFIKWLAAIIIAVVVFFIGANHYRMQFWPFGEGYFDTLDMEEVIPDSKTAKILSVFGSLDLKVFDIPSDDDFPSGPFEILGNDRFLFITKCGGVYFTQLENDHLRLINRDKGLVRNTVSGQDETDDLVYCKDMSGVKDSLLVNNVLYVSHTIWDSESNGARLAVSEFDLDRDNLKLSFKRQIFLSKPAIKEPFLGHQAGGRLVIGENSQTLYLAVGDFAKPDGVQDMATSLGKLIQINLKTLESEIYATGLRSPSGGLYFDKDTAELWESEHGPKGGDEVNLLKRDKNYGWPIVSYGTLYERDGMGNYYGHKFNNHEGYEKPIFTFVPSIGIGPIVKYPKTGRNEYWENDFFVAGMASMTLYRMKKEGERIVYAEPVLNGYRIRAIKIDPDGRFYIKTDHNQFLISD
ncbi:glucose sorbosone dehydrogenase [Methylovorus sp. MM2]|uniref:PQQ-dependent sugar dehydrogenase n=1 Tax=Methylovorus sp. MM2 TaxID=1848038 RepID=UPI0007E116CA|nr:PQQ-dependent sugar dehydrogenase [Methylovorus sp. MM2]OAM51495.1 glucose sorbosone dehydrogenase [Methylovorus sp. MM2]